MNANKVQDIEQNKPVVIKWDKKIVDNGAVTDGILHGVANKFLTRIDDEAKFISLCRYFGLDTVTQDIQHLRVKAQLQNMNQLSTGTTPGAQVDDITTLTETTPAILKQTVVAQPFTTFTILAKTFLKSNIEKESFINEYESILAPSVAYGIDRIALFGKIPSGGPTSSDGMQALNGIIAQLDAIAADDDTPELGKGSTVYLDNIIETIDNLLLEFTLQKGKRSEAKIFVDSKTEAKLIQALGQRETDGGDKLVFNDAGRVMFRGREVIQIDALDDAPKSGSPAVQPHYIIIANPASIIYAPLLEMDSEAEYSVRHKAYLTSIDVWFDVAILYAQDVLYADVVDVTPTD